MQHLRGGLCESDHDRFRRQSQSARQSLRRRGHFAVPCLVQNGLRFVRNCALCGCNGKKRLRKRRSKSRIRQDPRLESPVGRLSRELAGSASPRSWQSVRRGTRDGQRSRHPRLLFRAKSSRSVRNSSAFVVSCLPDKNDMPKRGNVSRPRSAKRCRGWRSLKPPNLQRRSKGL